MKESETKAKHSSALDHIHELRVGVSISVIKCDSTDSITANHIFSISSATLTPPRI